MFYRLLGIPKQLSNNLLFKGLNIESTPYNVLVVTINIVIELPKLVQCFHFRFIRQIPSLRIWVGVYPSHEG